MKALAFRSDDLGSIHGTCTVERESQLPQDNPCLPHAHVFILTHPPAPHTHTHRELKRKSERTARCGKQAKAELQNLGEAPRRSL